MIPKIIHYCWFGKNTKSELILKCLNSWKRYCSEWKIIEWNEDNYDLSCAPPYVREAYQSGKWAFVSDYVRLDVVYKYGGVYFDTDVEIIKPIESLLKYDAFFGFDDQINTGIGFGAVKHNKLINDLRDGYLSLQFKLDNGLYNLSTCSDINEPVFLKYGFVINGKTQNIDNMIAFSTEFFSPYSNPYYHGKLKTTRNTYSIHWDSRSWLTAEEIYLNRQLCKEARKNNLKHKIAHIPNMALIKILGNDKYQEWKVSLQRLRRKRSTK